MRGARLAWLAIVALGCGGTAKPVEEPTKKLPDIDPDQAESDAKGLVTEVYSSISKGNTDDLQTLLSEDLFVFGPRRGDALANREDTVVALGKVVDANNKKLVKSAALAVVPGPGGHSAVAFDAIDAGGRPLSVVAVLSNDGDLWAVSAASVADAPTAVVLKKELAHDAVVPPGMADPAAAKTAKLDASARAVVVQWRHGLAAQDEWGAELMSTKNGVYVGPGVGDVAHGKPELKKLWRQRLDANAREVAIGDVTAATTPDGRMVWVSAPVERVIGKEMMPVRVFAVYARHGDGWKMCALQESVTIEAPGAGAKYKKLVPPAAPAAKPAADDGDGDAPKPKRKFSKPKKPADEVNADDDAPKPKRKVKPKPADDDDAAASDDDAPKPKKAKVKPKPADDDDAASSSDDDAPKPKKKKPKPKPADDDDD